MVAERTMVLRTPVEVERALTVLMGLTIDAKHPWEVVIRHYKLKRTLQQNKRYHAVCTEIAEQLMPEGRPYSEETWKEHFKRTFIGTNETPMPDGTVFISGISTTTLNTGKFAVFMTKIDAYASERGVIFMETRQMLNEWAKQAQEWNHRHRNDPE